MPKAVVGAATSGLIACIAWAWFGIASGFQATLFASVIPLLLGAFIGWSTWILGRGLNPKFGLVAGTAALASSLVAMILIYTYTQATHEQLNPISKLLDIRYSTKALLTHFHVLDLLFLFLAGFIAFMAAHKEYPDQDRFGFLFND